MNVLLDTALFPITLKKTRFFAKSSIPLRAFSDKISHQTYPWLNWVKHGNLCQKTGNPWPAAFL
jgi:hypothetical protein